jgi:hypothetical protein
MTRVFRIASGSREKVNLYLAPLDDFANPVPLDADVFHATMVFGVAKDLESGLVVDHERRGSNDLHAEFLK